MHFMTRLTGVATVADEVHGFSYFDNRDLLGFVDGTENPVDQAAVDATVIGDEDPAFAGGELRHRSEISTRSGGLERAAGGNAGTHGRALQAFRHRDGRKREAQLCIHMFIGRPPRQLRPLARLQPGRHRHSFFRSFKQLAGRNQPGR